MESGDYYKQDDTNRGGVIHDITAIPTINLKILSNEDANTWIEKWVQYRREATGILTFSEEKETNYIAYDK